MLEALEKCLGIVSDAAKVAGIDRTTHYRWLNDDPEYKAAVEELDNVSLDFAESCLFKQMKEGNAASIIFFLKTKGRGRGYIERANVDHTTNGEPIRGFEISIVDSSAIISEN